MKGAYKGLLLMLMPGIASALPNHCKSSEEIKFNCIVRNSGKIASVCVGGFDYVNKVPGFIQYRFGSSNKVEFAYPAGIDKKDQADRFYASSGIAADQSFTESELVFKNGAWMYRLSYREDDRNTNYVKKESLVEVWQGKYGKGMKNYKTFQCSNANAGERLELVWETRMLNMPEFKFEEF